MLLKARRLDLDGSSAAAVQDYFEAQGWTDGLPIVPPTPHLVEAMVEGSGLAPDAVVARVAPTMAAATVEIVAIHAVMAGCRPAFMPAVLAALRALARDDFNLSGIQATTHPVAPMLMFNGPVRLEIGINCGTNAFGQGSRANATIGRAVRMVLVNIGGAIPGRGDMATLGTPCKYTFCAGENEEQSPWEPFHVERGFAASDSTVTVHAGEAPRNVQDHASTEPDELLMVFADTISTSGTNNVGLMGEIMVVVGPEHARLLAGKGMTRQDLREELWRRTRFSFSRMSPTQREWYRKMRPAFDLGPEVTEIPYLDDPRQFLVMVAGGPGLHSMVIPSFGTSVAMTERLEAPGDPGHRASP